MRSMKMILSATLVAFAAMLGATSAMAQVGCQIGVQAGGSIASTELSGGGNSIDGAGSRSTRPDVGVRGACGAPIPSSPFKLFAFVEANNQDVKFSVNPGLFSASLGNSYAGGVGLGVMMGTAMPYVAVGYTRTDVSSTGGVLPGSFQGATYLAGVEFPTRWDRVTMAGEARWTRFESQAVGGIDVRPDQLQTMFRVNVQLFSPATVAPLK